jgi:hypothetical protein
MNRAFSAGVFLVAVNPGGYSTLAVNAHLGRETRIRNMLVIASKIARCVKTENARTTC